MIRIFHLIRAIRHFDKNIVGPIGTKTWSQLCVLRELDRPTVTNRLPLALDPAVRREFYERQKCETPPSRWATFNLKHFGDALLILAN